MIDLVPITPYKECNGIRQYKNSPFDKGRYFRSVARK